MSWRVDLLNKNRLGLILTVVAMAMILVTTYLALFFAPLPQTSVGATDEILSSIEGSKIRVAGFVSEIYSVSNPILSDPGMEVFALADFTDYVRYVKAEAEGGLTEPWWTIQPLILAVHISGWTPGQDPYPPFGLGVNLSAEGTITYVHGLHANTTTIIGYILKVGSYDDVKIGVGPGEFGLVTAPIAQKIFYFHMPSAWVSYLSFFVTLIGSVLYLKTRNSKYDRLAFSSAELGVLFATIAISTGPIWAKQEWGVYWRWDDTKLVTTFILWLVYIGYLSLRAAIPEHSTKARISAVYGILGFVTVPMSLLSSRIAPLLRSSHPQVIATSSGGLSPEAGMTIGVAVIAFTILFAAMLIKRIEVAESEEELEELKRLAGGEE
jgi:heme exporter protein C